ncbi:MAG: hypothetical protein WB759_05205 [Methanoregula sp.]
MTNCVPPVRSSLTVPFSCRTSIRTRLKPRDSAFSQSRSSGIPRPLSLTMSVICDASFSPASVISPPSLPVNAYLRAFAIS